jgi:hypothetical protein
MLDKRIGKYHGDAPALCAACGQALQSGATGMALNDVFYIKVNPGCVITPDQIKELLLIVSPKKTKKSEDES